MNQPNRPNWETGGNKVCRKCERSEKFVTQKLIVLYNSEIFLNNKLKFTCRYSVCVFLIISFCWAGHVDPIFSQALRKAKHQLSITPLFVRSQPCQFSASNNQHKTHNTDITQHRYRERGRSTRVLARDKR